MKTIEMITNKDKKQINIRIPGDEGEIDQSKYVGQELFLDFGRKIAVLRGVEGEINLENAPGTLRSEPMFEVLNDPAIKHKVYKAFEKMLGTKPPVSELTVTPELFVAMVRFQLFSEDFYRCIPFDDEGIIPDSIQPSFSNLDEAIEQFNHSPLSKVRGFLDALIAEQGLFWYLKELEMLSSLFINKALALNMIRRESIYPVLMLLHQYPSTYEFFKDYVSMNGVQVMVELSTYIFEKFARMAVSYAAMSDDYKMRVRESWKISKFKPDFELVGFVPAGGKNLPDWDCGEYHFRNMHTEQQRTQAEQQLNMWIGKFHMSKSMLIYNKDKIIAVASYHGDTIHSVHGDPRIDLRNDAELMAAIRKWGNEFGLDYSAFFEFEEEDK